nr:hypothetical protein [uncultured Mediterranean phage uvMED]BAR21310.1 hypothetical protein [uncultured Mediterranean phage uvMED]BAR21445.1 hypothetical protein [uncultured Mediterranean phage uvMED]BAR38573.1 hypothetical protein [uncultured Mediterranean phage uvMED]
MAKTKITMFLDPELIEWLDLNRDEETSRSAYLRILIRKDMKTKSRRKTALVAATDDKFSSPVITADLIPDDLKEYSELLIEWWPIRKQKGGSCTTSVANRIFKTLRSFPSQDRKEALEKAITGGWKDIYPLKKGYKPEEPKNNHPAARVFTARGGFEL